jgi:cell shape-determining protein MreC
VKVLTREQLERRKEKAVRFTRDVLDDPDRADEIADESLEDYAERKKIALANPRRKRNMARRAKTREELQDEIDDLKSENQQLQDQLDSIADIVAPGDEDEDQDEDQDQD